MPTLKAYEVREPYEGHCAIVFATNNAAARRKGATELGIEWEGVEHCQRHPKFDEYASAGKVPPLVLMDHGWWFECQHCGCRVNDDHIDYNSDRELTPVADTAGNVYCCQEHMMLDWAEWQQRKAEEYAAIEAALLTFPGITNVRGRHYYTAGGRDTELTAEFDFPGATGSVRWPVGGKLAYVRMCDEQAWKVFSKPHQRPEPADQASNQGTL